MSDKLQPNSADKELVKSISLNIHRHFLGFSGFRLFTQRVKGQNDEKARGYWVNRIFQILIGGFGLKFVEHRSRNSEITFQVENKINHTRVSANDEPAFAIRLILAPSCERRMAC
jgi:hypothetical protein